MTEGLKLNKYQPVAFHFNGDVINQYPAQSLLPLENILSANSKAGGGKYTGERSSRILTFDNRFDRPRSVGMLSRLGLRPASAPTQRYPLKEPFLVNCCEQLGLDAVNLGDDEYYGPVKEKYKNPSRRLAGSHGSKRFQGGFLLTHKIFSVFDYLKHNRSHKYFYFFDQSDVF